MTSKAVRVHRPVPGDVDLVLRRAGYQPVTVSATVTEYQLEAVDPEPAGPQPVTTEKTPRLLYRPEEVAHILGIGRTTVYGLLKTGQLRSIQVGSCRRIPVTSITAYVANLEECPDPENGHKLRSDTGIAASPDRLPMTSPLSPV